GDPLAQPLLLRLLPHGQLVPSLACRHTVWGHRLHRLLLGRKSGVHRAGDGDDGLAGEDADAARGIFGWTSGRRGW
ncbi:unnamed protein product, partial [Gulo gulo]